MKTQQERLDSLMQDEDYNRVMSKYDHLGNDYFEKAINLAYDVKCLRSHVEVLADVGMEQDIALQALVGKLIDLDIDGARKLADLIRSRVNHGYYEGEKSDELKELFGWEKI